MVARDSPRSSTLLQPRYVPPVIKIRRRHRNQVASIKTRDLHKNQHGGDSSGGKLSEHPGQPDSFAVTAQYRDTCLRSHFTLSVILRDPPAWSKIPESHNLEK